MKTWNSDDAATLTAPEEITIATVRADGTVRRPRTIWIVGVGDRVFIRSTNGRTADWFRGATATGRAHVDAGGASFEVVLTEADVADLDAVDAAYREAYGRYADIVDHLLTDGPRAATLEIHPT